MNQGGYLFKLDQHDSLFCIYLKNSIKVFEKILSKHTHEVQEEGLIFRGSETHASKGKLSASLTNLEIKLFTDLKNQKRSLVETVVKENPSSLIFFSQTPIQLQPKPTNV